MTNPNLTQAARMFMDAKSAKDRETIRAYIVGKAEKPSKKTWPRLAAAVEAGDMIRVEYYATPYKHPARKELAELVTRTPMGKPSKMPAAMAAKLAEPMPEEPTDNAQAKPKAAAKPAAKPAASKAPAKKAPAKRKAPAKSTSAQDDLLALLAKNPEATAAFATLLKALK